MKKSKPTEVEVMDTTLRDGEQCRGHSYGPAQKLNVVRLLLTQLGVDRVEVTSARVSAGEQQMLALVTAWAKSEGFEQRIEVLGFVDGIKSVDWIHSAGGRVINLLCKGSERHCQVQLKKSLTAHLHDIVQTVQYAVKQGLEVNAYLEDWSQGMINSPEYARGLLAGLAQLPISRVMLCDTMGVLNPWQTEKLIKQVTTWQPGLRLDFHGHNDYGLAVANALAAVKTGFISAVHCTINGLGERAGNASLDEVVVGIKDHTGFTTRVNEASFQSASRLIAAMSGRRVPPNKPITGSSVFVNVAGVHADGDRKGRQTTTGQPLYMHPNLTPARFGAQLEHSLGKLAGVASIQSNAERLGLELSEAEARAVSTRVNQLGDEGRIVTIADLLYIIADVLGRPECIIFEVIDVATISMQGKRAVTSGMIKFRRRSYEISGHGDGGFDAFMNALRRWAKRRKNVVVPKLIDYDVSIPPGGSSAALVQVTITWLGPNGEGEFQTVGVHCDQVLAAINAAAAALNVCNQDNHKS